MMNTIVKSEIVYFILYSIIVTADPCVDYCHNDGKCTLKFDGDNYKPACECTPEHAGDKCQLRKWHVLNFL